jgi:hypothetical protein
MTMTMTKLPSRSRDGMLLPDAVLVSPPDDVRQLLECHDAQLPQYFDAQRTEALRRAGQAWPCLRHLARGPE